MTAKLAATLICATSTFSLRPYLMQIAPTQRSAKARIGGELRDVFRNRSFVVLFLTVVIFWVAQGTAGNLSVHAFRYFWGLTPEVIQRVLIAGTVGLTCGIPVCAWLLRRFEKRDVAAIGLALVCVCLFLPPTLRVAGLLERAAALDGDWRTALREWEGDADFYTSRERPLNEVLPWDHLEVGVKKANLVREHQRAGLSPEPVAIA